MYPDVPHLRFPLALEGDHLAAVEQDDLDDVAGCVEVILRTPIGSRPDEPDFGLNDLTFTEGDINVDELARIIVDWEPRFDGDVEGQRDAIDVRLENLTLSIRGATSG